MYIFVYGTLKQGFRNAHFLKDAEFICQTTTKHPDYRMVVFESRIAGQTYPAVFDGGESLISGEVYKVIPMVLEKLDDLEDEGLRYKRVPIDLDCDIAAEFYLSLEYDRPVLETNLEYAPDTKTYRYIEM